jgi:hypothetical protein
MKWLMAVLGEKTGLVPLCSLNIHMNCYEIKSGLK